jgi:hypothetical protein
MMRQWMFALALASSTGCVTSVVPGPMTIGGPAVTAQDATPIQEVRASRCNRVFLIIPVVPQPREALAELMEEARKVGGNTVIDFEVRNTGVGGFIPFYVQACYEARGMAAKI